MHPLRNYIYYDKFTGNKQQWEESIESALNHYHKTNLIYLMGNIMDYFFMKFYKNFKKD